MEIKITPKTPKNAKLFNCKSCDFICSKNSDFIRHCDTRKHKMEIMEINTKINGKYNIGEQNTGYTCNHCSKKYETNAGLWKHSKKCTSKLPSESVNIILQPEDDILSSEPIKNYIMKLVEQNQALQNMFMIQNNKHQDELKEIKTILVEQPPQIVNNNIQNNKITNNQFNLNVFLQQTCKDAINMSDFINSLEINTKSLERTGTHGYVNGISKIFTDGLRKLKVQERPIHCTDLKREVLYIKDNNTWTKDTEDNKQFKKALATVVHRNMIQIVKWEEDNPDTSNPESKTYEFYFEVVRQSLGGGDHEVTARNNDKILKAIAQEVHIDKKVKELL